MIDTLKAIGIPVTAAAVISALVVSVPLLFKLDERYAKEEDLRSEVAALKQANGALQRELAQLAGFQQAMTSFIAEGRLPRAAQAEPVPTPAPPVAAVRPTPRVEPTFGGAAPAPTLSAPAASAIRIEKPRDWRELNEGLVRQQQRLYKD